MQKETQQEAIIEVLESNFGEHIIAAFEASQFFKLKQMIVDCKEKNHSPLRTVFINLQGEPNESAKQIGRELNHVGGLKSMQGVADALLVFCKNEGYSTSDVRELEYCWDGIGEYRDWETDRKSTRLNSSHRSLSRMPSSA